MSANEIWKVDVEGVLYDADSDTLRQWILDGYLTPATKVQKGSLKWIEVSRVPAFRGLFGSDQQYSTPPVTEAVQTHWEPESSVPAFGGVPDPPSNAYAAPSGAPTGGACVNHPLAPSKFVCQGCSSSLCLGCVKRYGNAAVCSRCGELCIPVATAEIQSVRQAHLAGGYGLNDFALAIQYPFKDPIALGVTALVYGVLLLFGIYGRAFAAGLLFGDMSHAIRRVSMGHFDEGPSPDLSDPGDLIFEAGKLGSGVALITYGPLVLVAYFTLSSLFDADFDSLASVGAGLIGLGIAGLWALFYYPMALLVAGYTNSFFATINPLVGVATMGRLGLDYVKAYLMVAAVFLIQFVLTRMVGVIGPLSEGMPSKLIEAGIWLLQYVIQGSIAFVASMVMAALLGLVLYKRPDVVDVDV